MYKGRVKSLSFAIRAHYMGYFCINIFTFAVLAALQITITHKRHAFTVYRNNPMDNVMIFPDTGKHHIHRLNILGLNQEHAITATFNKRAHASPVHRENHLDTFVN